MSCCCHTRAAASPPLQGDRPPDLSVTEQSTATHGCCEKSCCDCAKGEAGRCECHAAA